MAEPESVSMNEKQRKRELIRTIASRMVGMLDRMAELQDLEEGPLDAEPAQQSLDETRKKSSILEAMENVNRIRAEGPIPARYPGDKIPGVEYSGPVPYPFPNMPTGVKWAAETAREQLDPWANRQNRMRCATCIFFAPKPPAANPLTESQVPPYHIGRCRRHAPAMGGYPLTLVNDWCGDHRLDENKVR